jgi:phasin family protein
MLDETVAASMQRTAKEDNSGFNFPQMAFIQPSLEKALAYSRCAYEILLESQQEIIHTLSSQFSSMNANFKAPANWTAPFEIFTKGMQDVSSLAKKNASATTEASKSAITESRSRLSKAA